MKISNANIPVSEATRPAFTPAPSDNLRTSAKFPCRDPFILPYDGKYYFYQGAGKNGITCTVSNDLETWSEKVTVFTVPENFHGVKDMFWAPECHYYNGKFYIFTSVFSSTYNHRVISVYRADNPLGPFEDIAGGCITPKDWDAIDGTLYVDENDQPWMVFVHEWTSMPDHNGGMAAAKLAPDFTHFISQPLQLFLAKDPAWAKSGVTDGPFLFKTDDGVLSMIWSNFSEKGYVVAVASSDNGLIEGKWSHRDHLLYEKDMHPDFTTDGGHAMIFIDNQGKLRLALHGPNGKRPDGDFEHLQLFYLEQKNGTIEII